MSKPTWANTQAMWSPRVATSGDVRVSSRFFLLRLVTYRMFSRELAYTCKGQDNKRKGKATERGNVLLAVFCFYIFVFL